MQAHVGIHDPANSRRNVAKQIKKFGDLGLKVHITELDVKLDNNSDWDYAKQAEIYRDFLAACFVDNPGVCTAFLTWGVSDAHTWLGTAKHPLPFNERYVKKQSYNYMLDLLNE